MKLEEGMYVRTEKGIAKYLGLGKDVLTINESNQFKHYANQHLFDDYIFDVGHDWGDTLSSEEFKSIDKYIEKDPSYNLIDLIKVGDYVNGELIIVKFYDYANEEWNLVTSSTKHLKYSENRNDIKSIVTKEQFNSVIYEVE